MLGFHDTSHFCMLATRKLLQMAGYQSSFTDGLLHIENYSNFRESKSYGIVFFFWRSLLAFQEVKKHKGFSPVLLKFWLT